MRSKPVIVSPLGLTSAHRETVDGAFFDPVELPDIECDIVSTDMSVEDLKRACAECGFEFFVPSDIREVILRGHWRSTASLVEEIGHTFGLVPRSVSGSIVLRPSDEALDYVRWASGRSDEEVGAIISSLNFVELFAVDRSGVAFLGVSPDRVEDVKAVLRGLDQGDDWLCQISVVDSSGTAGGDVSVISGDAAVGGWSVDGNELVETFVLTLHAGQPVVQSFGSRVPFRTSLVTEQGVIVSGGVEYQDIRSSISVEVVEGASGARGRVRVESRRPGSEADGLFEILEEDLESEFFIRPEPVLVGSLRRWDAATGSDLRYPFSFFRRYVSNRTYKVYCHAVRLAAPVSVEVAQSGCRDDDVESDWQLPVIRLED